MGRWIYTSVRACGGLEVNINLLVRELFMASKWLLAGALDRTSTLSRVCVDVMKLSSSGLEDLESNC